jgi:ribonuclease HII
MLGSVTFGRRGTARAHRSPAWCLGKKWREATQGAEQGGDAAHRFNEVVRHSDNKATIPLQCASELVQAIQQHCNPAESIHIVVDRLGGRWHYGERIADWFAGQPVQCLEETGLVSRYKVGDNIIIEFVVEADGNSLPVALASMVSKYLRELFMRQFNSWFQEQQPGIAPTAGYPVDSHRFWQEAEPTRTRLGLINEDWWRER